MASEALSAFVRFYLKDEVSGEASKVESSAKQAASGMDKAADSAGTRLKGGLDKMKSAAGTAAKGLAAIGAGASAMIGGVVALSGSTEDYSSRMKNLTNTFEYSGRSAEDARKTYQGFLGILGDTDTAVEAASLMNKLADAGADVDEWMTIAAGAASAFPDSLPIEGLIESSNETLRTAQVTGVLADALNWTSVNSKRLNSQMSEYPAVMEAWNGAIAEGASNEDAMNAALAACSNEQERATLLSNVLGQQYSELGSGANVLNEDIINARLAQDDFNAKMAEAGDAVRPISTGLIEIGAAILDKAMPYLEEFAGWFQEQIPTIQQYIQDFIAQAQPAFDGLKTALEPIATNVLPLVKDAFFWFLENLPALLPIIVAVGGAFIAYSAITGIVNGVEGAMKLAKSATVAWEGAQKLLNAAMKANPIGIVISIIGLLVGAFVTAYTSSEDFRNKVNNAFGSVKDFIGGAIDSVKGFIGGLVDKFNEVKNKAAEIKDGIVGAFNGIKDGIGNAINNAKDTVIGAVDRIKGAFNFSWSLPSIKLPHFSVSGKFGLNPPSIPRFNVSWYAKGAVFDEPTIFPTANGLKGVGEAGAEAVAPISVLQKYITDAVAAALGGNGGCGYVANINVTTGETDESKLAKLIAREERRNAYALGVL